MAETVRLLPALVAMPELPCGGTGLGGGAAGFFRVPVKIVSGGL